MKPAKKYFLDIDPYIPGRPIEDVKRELGLRDVIKLASNENPYPPSKKVLSAIYKSALTVNRYPDGGCLELGKELAKRLHVHQDQLIFGNGSDELIILAIKAFVNEGDEVIIAKPSFLVYRLASLLAGAQLHEVPLKDFHYDITAMKAKLTRRTKIVFIGNPDNPSGTYVPIKELESLIQAASPETLIFLDEAYFEYVQAKDYPDGLKLSAKYPNVMVTRTFSKMYGLAGLRIGYGCARRDVIDILNRLREPFNVNSIAQSAALAALKDKSYLTKISAAIKHEREFMYHALTALNIPYQKSFTNFILINVGENSSQISKALLAQGIIIRDMSAWGLKGYIRVSLGTSVENKRFINSLAKVMS